jgi:hypothetical protein
MAIGILEKSIRDSTFNLLTSRIVAHVLDDWAPERKAEFIELYRHGRWNAMHDMLKQYAEGLSGRTVNTVCDILAEVIEEQNEDKA